MAASGEVAAAAAAEREAKELAEMRARLGIDTGDAGMDLAGQR